MSGWSKSDCQRRGDSRSISNVGLEKPRPRLASCQGASIRGNRIGCDLHRFLAYLQVKMRCPVASNGVDPVAAVSDHVALLYSLAHVKVRGAAAQVAVEREQPVTMTQNKIGAAPTPRDRRLNGPCRRRSPAPGCRIWR